MSVDNLASQWQTVHYLAGPTQLLKFLEVSASDFGSMRRRFFTYANEFLTMVTEGVVHGVHRVLIRSSFGVKLQHKVS